MSGVLVIWSFSVAVEDPYDLDVTRFLQNRHCCIFLINFMFLGILESYMLTVLAPQGTRLTPANPYKKSDPMNRPLLTLVI